MNLITRWIPQLNYQHLWIATLCAEIKDRMKTGNVKMKRHGPIFKNSQFLFREWNNKLFSMDSGS